MRTVYSKHEIAEMRPLPNADCGEWLSLERDNQILGARIHRPEVNRSPGEIIIDDSAWGVNSSTAFDVVRTSQLAKESGLLTIAIETPGMSPYSGPLTPNQIEGLKKGDWSLLGRAQWEIITKALQHEGLTFSDDQPLTVHYAGYSMAASTLIGVLANAPDWTRTGHFIAWENVALSGNESGFMKLKRARRVAAMMLGFAYSGLGMRNYRNRAPKVPSEIVSTLQNEVSDGRRSKVKQSRMQALRAQFMPILAMASGGDAKRLCEAIVRRGEQSTACVHLWHGDKSRLLSKRNANNYGKYVLGGAGINNVDLQHDADGGHNVEDLTPFSVRRYAETIALPLPVAS